MALAAVSRLVVVARYSFLDAIFARLLAKTDEIWSIDHKIGVIVDEHSTGDSAIEALSRPGAVTSSATLSCGPRC